MTIYDGYLGRIEGTWATASFAILADDLDADDSLSLAERDVLKRYAMYKLRCINRISKEYEIEGNEFFIDYMEGHDGRFLARVKLQDYTEDDQLIGTILASIMIKPGVEIKVNPESVAVLEDDELKVLLYPGGLK